MTTAMFSRYPQLRSDVERCLRDGMALREIGALFGISHQTVWRYAVSARRERPRETTETTETTDEIRDAAQRLSFAFNHFDHYRDRVSYDAWIEAQRDYESLRRAQHAN